MHQSPELLIVKKLSKHYHYYKSVFNLKKDIIKAVDNVSFEVKKGEIFSIVGETGCGKSTLSKLISGLIPATSGTILYDGIPLNYNLKGLRKKIQIVFQDPYSSLNPKKRIYKTVSLPALKNKIVKRHEKADFTASLLKRVGLDGDYVFKFPYELSGGQRQRVSIARSLSVKPELLILDEPVSALDVSVSAQILNLLIDLHEKDNITYIFITHDLKIVRHIANSVCVMFSGKIMEISPVNTFFENPAHPYSKILLESTLSYEPNKVIKFIDLGKKINTAGNNAPAGGCVYYQRCYAAKDICRDQEPELKKIAGKDIFVSCFFPFAEAEK